MKEDYESKLSEINQKKLSQEEPKKELSEELQYAYNLIDKRNKEL